MRDDRIVPPSDGPELPTPVLLDTCVVQHLTWVYERQQEPDGWSDDHFLQFRHRYGQLADEIRSLWDLVEIYEHDFAMAPPWLVSAASRVELERISDSRRAQVLATWDWYRQNSDDWAPGSFATIAPGLLESEPLAPNPLLLKALKAERFDALLDDGGPLASFPDRGDRRLVREAIFAGVQTLLTTDFRTMWRHRREAAELGLVILRPSELLDLVAPPMPTAPSSDAGSGELL